MTAFLPSFQVLNRFLEDTCVLATVAYLLSRGGLLPRLSSVRRRGRDLIALALMFGLIGGSETFFPGDRYPYVIFTLAAAFAGYAGGLALGLLSAVVMLAFAALAYVTGLRQPLPIDLLLSVIPAALIGTGTAWVGQRFAGAEGNGPRRVIWLLIGASLAGAAGEAAHSGLLLAVHGQEQGHGLADGGGRFQSAGMATLAFYSMAANGFGCLLLALILWDAQERQAAGQRHIQAEMELTSLRLSQLGELQARLHPHFLFNTLAGIAGLCVTHPRQAEQGVTDLAHLLRQFLRAPTEVSVPLREELALVRSYLAIERLRLGERLQVEEDLPENLLSLLVPRFSLQVPVENAVQHGIAPLLRPGRVVIIARRRRTHLVLAVSDDGTGVTRTTSEGRYEGDEARPHGLTLLTARLRLAYGTSARIRLFSPPGCGTLCVLRLPLRTVK